MTKSIMALATGAMLLTACQVAQAPENNATEATAPASESAGADETAIRGQVEQWLKFVKAKDAAGIAALYADDGVVMPPNAPIAKGHSAIQQTWAGMMAMPGFELNFVPDQIVVSSSGDMALDRGTYTLAVSPDGKPQTETGKYVVVWRKIGGEWKAAADIFNSDAPPNGG